MYLKNLSLINFKNYEQADLSLNEKINCFAGDNGVGKTNLLDAIHYLSLCKSYFNPSDSQNIRYEQDFFVIQGSYQRAEEEENIYCGFKRNARKQFKRNKNDYEKLSEHIGFIPAVMISPYDSRLILGRSDERRRFIDSVISQYDKDYLDDLIRYNRILEQRNKLLKQMREGRFEPELLSVLNEQLCAPGESIHRKRTEFTEQLIPVFNAFYRHISSGSNERVKLEYVSSLNTLSFAELLKQSAEKDRILEYTSEGIHKDDLELLLDDLPIKRIGSQGQQKTFLTALKFAEFDFITRIKGFKPILLLDDIFDKFDETRVGQIIRLVSEEHFGQIFISDTDPGRMEVILKQIKVPFNLYVVERNGNINLKQSNS